MGRTLTDRSIIITGASSGIGAATALACAGAGMDVVITARRADRLEEVAERVDAAGRRATVVTGDAADPDLAQELLDAADRLGGVYAVFANAGIGSHKATIDMDEEELRRIFNVNYFGPWRLCRAAARRLVERGAPGHLLMCSSILAKLTLKDHGAYSATKAAQNHACRAMRLELRDHDIEVASVHPVTTRTELFRATAERQSGPVGAGYRDLPDTMPRILVQPPERVARAVVRCLRRPKPEVWTSITGRFGAAFLCAFPSAFDLIMRSKAADLR